MAIVDDVAQKLRGKGQKLRGKMRSNRVKGTIDEMKGTINETVADAKLTSRNRNKRNTW